MKLHLLILSSCLLLGCQSAEPEPTPEPSASAEPQPKRIVVECYEGEEVADLVERIGAQVGRTILVDPAVDAQVNLDLAGLTWQEAVDVVAKAAECEVVEREDGVILLVPAG